MKQLVLIFLLASSVWAGKWDKPDQHNNRRVHENKGKQFRIEVDDTTMALAVWDDLDMPAWISFRTFAVKPGAFSMKGDTIVISGGGSSARFYMADQQTFEWEAILANRPPVNSISFPINTENLEYFLQPNGSYAVYHSSKVWNNYRTGKAFHIYRPEVWDSAGDTIWADLTMANGQMTISVDQAWLDNATYPITIDPTFGLTSIGASSGTMQIFSNDHTAWNHYYLSDHYVAGANDVFTEVWVYGDSSSQPCSLMAGLYETDYVSGDSGVADTRYAYCDTVFPVQNGLRWIRLNAVTDYAITTNDTVSFIVVIDQDMVSHNDTRTRGTMIDGYNGVGLPSDITPDNAQSTRWSNFACINQEGAGGQLGHTASDYNLGTGWTNPDNGRLHDNACASYDDRNEEQICYHGYDFSLPAGATIDSIHVNNHGYGDGNTDLKRRYYCGLTKDSINVVGSAVLDTLTFNPAACLNSFDHTVKFTSPSISAAEANTRGLGVILYDADGNQDGLFFDAVYMTIYFTPAGVAGEVLPRRRKLLTGATG